MAIAALLLNGDWAEIKRMWVEENARGQGIAKALLTTLTEMARDEGVSVLRLEAGVYGHAALALYEGAGFQRRGPFGSHGADPLSIFLEKPL